MLALHRMRQQLIKFRTMQVNNLRGLLTEYGEIMGKSRAALGRAIPAVLERVAERLPAVVIDSLREQWIGLKKLDEQVAQIERQMREWKKEDKAVKAISEIAGVGLLTATAAVATMGDPKAFSLEGVRGVGWSCTLANGSGGKVILHGISKRGDTYLHAADSRCAIGVGTRERTWSMSRTDDQTSTQERGDRRACKQDGTDNLGGACARQAVPEGLRQCEARINRCASCRRSTLEPQVNIESLRSDRV